MTEIEALRARMREAAESGFDYLEVPASDCLALDAEITRLRDDLDRVTRERDEALAEAKRVVDLTQDANAVHVNMLRGGMARLTWEQVKHLYTAEFAAAEAALAKRDEEVARLREALMPLANAMSSIRLRANDPDDALLEILVEAGDVRRAAALTKETAS